MNLYCFWCRFGLCCCCCCCLLTIAIACAFSHHLFLALSCSPHAISLLSPCAPEDSVQMGFSLLSSSLFSQRLIAELFDLNAVPAPLPSQRNHFESSSPARTMPSISFCLFYFVGEIYWPETDIHSLENRNRDDNVADIRVQRVKQFMRSK